MLTYGFLLFFEACLPSALRLPNQSRATGKFLKKWFSENGYKFDKVIIESSPFLRCMISAAEIGKAFDCKDITINYRASVTL